MRTVAAFVVGLVLGGLVAGAVAQEAAGTLVARRLHLVDSRGDVRASLFVDEYGVPRIEGVGAEGAGPSAVGVSAKQFGEWITRFGLACWRHRWNEAASHLAAGDGITWELSAKVVDRPTDDGRVLVDLLGDTVYRTRVRADGGGVVWGDRAWGIMESRIVLDVASAPPEDTLLLDRGRRVRVLVSLGPDTGSQSWRTGRALQHSDGRIMWTMRYGGLEPSKGK